MGRMHVDIGRILKFGQMLLLCISSLYGLWEEDNLIFYPFSTRGHQSKKTVNKTCPFTPLNTPNHCKTLIRCHSCTRWKRLNTITAHYYWGKGLCAKIRKSSLRTQAKWIAVNSIIEPTVLYPLVNTLYPIRDLSPIESTISQMQCSALGLNRNFPQALLHGPPDLGGIGVPNYTRQNILLSIQHSSSIRHQSKTWHVLTLLLDRGRIFPAISHSSIFSIWSLIHGVFLHTTLAWNWAFWPTSSTGPWSNMYPYPDSFQWHCLNGFSCSTIQHQRFLHDQQV